MVYNIDIKGLISGATPITALILVLSATDTQSPFTTLKKYLHVARQSGIKKVCIFLNKVDQLPSSPVTPVLSELPGNSSPSTTLEKELRELLTEHKFDGARTPIISGSALAALGGRAGEKRRAEIGEKRVAELIKAADNWFDVPSREFNISSFCTHCLQY